MNESAKAELREIKQELNSILRELDSISEGIREDFVGIGNGTCSNCIDKVCDQYRGVQKKLNNLDTKTVTESYAKAHGGGGRRG